MGKLCKFSHGWLAGDVFRQAGATCVMIKYLSSLYPIVTSYGGEIT